MVKSATGINSHSLPPVLVTMESLSNCVVRDIVEGHGGGTCQDGHSRSSSRVLFQIMTLTP